MNTVFVYGILKTPEAIRNPPHSARGRMHLNGSIAVVKFDPAGWIVRGQLRTVDDLTLRHWDAIEGVDHDDPDQGFYRRIRIVTLEGVEAWAYEFVGDVERFPPVHDGVWRGRSVCHL